MSDLEKVKKPRKNVLNNLKNATTREILAFSLLPFGLLTFTNVIGGALNVYFSDVLGLGLVATGLILALTKVWDAVNDPMMGMLVDRTRTKWGKCRPWVISMSIPLCVSLVLLFAPVDFGDRFGTFTISQVNLEETIATIGSGFHVIRDQSGEISKGNFWYAVIAYLIFYTFNTTVDIPYQGLTPLVFPQSEQRVKAISWSNIIGSIGTVLPSIVFFPIVYAFADERQGYFVAAIVFAVLAGVPMIASFFGIREKVYIKPQKVKYSKTLKMIFKNKNMTVLIITAFFSAITNIGAMFLMYFAKWNCYGIFDFPAIEAWMKSTLGFSIPLSEEGILYPLLSISSGISYMLSMAIVPPLLKRMDKKTLWIRMSLIFAVADVLVFLICMYVVPYTSADLAVARAGFAVYAILRFFTNFPVGMSLVLITAIFSDTVDTIEMESGERLEGAVFSFKSLVNKFGVAGFNLIIMAIVNAFGYENLQLLATKKEELAAVGQTLQRSEVLQYEPALNAIFFMLTVMGAIGLVLQAIPMFFYKFNEKENEEKINKFRAEKEARLQAELDAAMAEQSAK